MIVLLAMAAVSDTINRAWHGDAYVNQQDVAATRQLDYQEMLFRQRDADDAALEAAEAQAKANEARQKLDNER